MFTESFLTDAKKEVSIGGVVGDGKVPTNPVSDCRDPVEPGNTLEPRQSGSICDGGRNTASPLLFRGRIRCYIAAGSCIIGHESEPYDPDRTSRMTDQITTEAWATAPLSQADLTLTRKERSKVEIRRLKQAYQYDRQPQIPKT